MRIYDLGHRGECRSERGEQIASMSWLKEFYPDYWALTMHCPSETKGTTSHHAIRAKEGVKAGIPDIIHLGGSGRYRVGMFEMKRQDRTKSKVTADQRRILELAEASGAFCAICYGFEAFKMAFADYQTGRKTPPFMAGM